MKDEKELQELILGTKQLLPASLIDMESLDAAAIHATIALAQKFESTDSRVVNGLLRGKVIGTLFYQPSTRTRLSFESAAQRLGMGVTGFADPATTRAGDFYKETLEDVIRFTSELVDLIVLRHPETGATTRAANNSIVPILSAGDGYGQHPTQALGDILTMTKLLGPLEKRTIGMIGDANLRTLKAASIGLATIGVGKILYLLPRDRPFPDTLRQSLTAKGIAFEFVDHIDALLAQADLVESIGINHPYRNLPGQPREGVQDDPNDKSWYQITRSALEKAAHRPAPFVMHPGPRTDELSTDVDGHPSAKYFEQTRNGMWVRMALIAALCP